jgi:uncharacterized protein
MASADALLRVEVVFAAGPHQLDSTALTLPAGATVQDALRASGLAQRHDPGLIDSLVPGVWGKAQALDSPLRDGDRLELYRGLLVDPKEARRQRYKRDGVKRAR